MPNKGTVALGVALTVLLLSAYPQAAEPDDTGEDGDVLIKLIVAEQQKNLAQIHSLKFTLHVLRRSPLGGMATSEFERQVIRRGECGWSHTSVSQPVPAHPEHQRRTTTTWNERSVATWPRPGPWAYLIESESQNTRPEMAKRYIQAAVAYPELEYGYGTGSESLAGILAKRLEYHLRIEVKKDGDLYLVQTWDTQGSWRYPLAELIVDPAQGYMVTHVLSQDVRNGNQVDEISVVPREVAPGIWYPASWTVKGYGEQDPETGEQPVVLAFEYTMSSIEANPTVPDEQFTWTALNLEPSTEVLRTDTSGSKVLMKVMNGELVPKDEHVDTKAPGA